MYTVGRMVCRRRYACHAEVALTAVMIPNQSVTTPSLHGKDCKSVKLVEQGDSHMGQHMIGNTIAWQAGNQVAHMSRNRAHCSTRLHRTEAATSKLMAAAQALNNPAVSIVEPVTF